MSAIRNVLHTEEYPILLKAVKRRYHPVASRRLPKRFADEESDQAGLQNAWDSFCDGIDVMRGIRDNRMMNRFLRRATIKSGMENLCTEFNRKTQNTLVEFKHHKEKEGRRTRYYIRLLQLSHVSKQIRNARGMTAEIPTFVPNAQLVVRDTNGSGGWVPYNSGRSYSNRNSRIQWVTATTINSDADKPNDPSVIIAEAEALGECEESYAEAPIVTDITPL